MPTSFPRFSGKGGMSIALLKSQFNQGNFRLPILTEKDVVRMGCGMPVFAGQINSAMPCRPYGTAR